METKRYQAQRIKVVQLRMALQILEGHGFTGTADDLRKLLGREELHLLALLNLEAAGVL